MFITDLLLGQCTSWRSPQGRAKEVAATWWCHERSIMFSLKIMMLRWKREKRLCFKRQNSIEKEVLEERYVVSLSEILHNRVLTIGAHSHYTDNSISYLPLLFDDNLTPLICSTTVRLVPNLPTWWYLRPPVRCRADNHLMSTHGDRHAQKWSILLPPRQLLDLRMERNDW